MKPGWEVKPLGEVCSIIMGQAPSGKDCNKEGHGTPFVKAGEFGPSRPIIREWTTDPKKLARHSDVLICVVGATCGKINLGADCAIGRSAAALRPAPDRLDQFFLHYFLEGQVGRLRRGSLGSAQTVISKDMLASTSIPLPPLEEQRRIVAVLDEAFEGLNRARQNTEANLASARELFESFKSDAFRRCGNDAQSVTLADVTEIVSSLVDPRSTAYQDLPHIGAGNMVSGSNELIDVKTAKEEGLKSGKYTFDESSILYSKIRPYLRKVARPDFSGLCSADVYPLIPKGGILDRDYLFHLLQGAEFTQFAISGSDRAGMPKVNRDHLFSYRFNLPSLVQQQEIVRAVDAAQSDCHTLSKVAERKLANLEELRQSLLQKAFAGELTATASAEATTTDANSSDAAITAAIIMLAHHAHKSAGRDRTFGHVKAQKVIHLADQFAGLDLDRQPMKDAAGPNDFQHMLKAEAWAEERGAFRMKKRAKGGGYDFCELENHSSELREARQRLAPHMDTLKPIFDLFIPMSTNEAQVFATVHAAWNNLIMDGGATDDETIVTEARERWHLRKTEIDRQLFFKAIKQIRASGLLPDGTGKYVGGQASLL